MLEEILSQYFVPMLIIIGIVQFGKNIKKKGFSINHILQITGCLIMAAIFGFKQNTEIVISIIDYFVKMISFTTIFWDFIFKKIKGLGNGKVK